MKNTKILEMLNNGEIEELKQLLSSEIYANTLTGNRTAKKRYAAMKRYFAGKSKDTREFMNKPGTNISYNGKKYNAFCDTYCAVLTTEGIGTMETCNDYLNIVSIFDIGKYKAESENLSINDLLAEAKSKGYKYLKKETGANENFQYLLKYKETFFKIGLIDKAFSIIDDGNIAEVIYLGKKAPLHIKTDIGEAIILPVAVKEENIDDSKIIIER